MLNAAAKSCTVRDAKSASHVEVVNVADLGVTPDRIEQISADPHHVAFPPPVMGGLFVWVSNLTCEQLLAAVIIYTEKYTFDHGSEFNKMVMETLEEEVELRKGLEPNIGDLVHSKTDQRSYFFTGRDWKELGVVKVQYKGNTNGTQDIQGDYEDGGLWVDGIL